MNLLDVKIPEKATNCADVDPEMFFDEARIDEAQEVCEGCWFRFECQAIGQREGYGTWGGLNYTALTEEREPTPSRFELSVARITDRVLELTQQKLSVKEIATRVAAGRTTVLAVLEEHRPDYLESLRAPSSSASAARHREARARQLVERLATANELLSEGATVEEAAKAISMRPHTLYDHLAEQTPHAA